MTATGCHQVLTVVGARPQFIKAAAISRAVARLGLLDERLLHTGQHYDDALSDRFFRELKLPKPAHHLGVGSGTHGAQTAAMLVGIERVLLEERPDAVLVYGDTNSTLAAALAASKLHVPVAHVEAGLRSFNRKMPEETNRVLTDHCSTWCYAPSDRAAEQLAREGVTEGVVVTGDVMLDVIRFEMETPVEDPVSRASTSGRFALATVHRAESTDAPAILGGLVDALERLVAQGLPVVLPLHPRTQAALERYGLAFKGVDVIPSVGHRALLDLADRAEVVITDSGGLQKEAFWLKTPCVTLRDETEWTETVDGGWNTLAGRSPDAVVAAVEGVTRPAEVPTPYGDGTAADTIVRHLADALSSVGDG